MTVKPDTIPFNDFVNAHKEEFAPFELWIVDELTEYVVNKVDLDKEFTSVIVDCDEDEPVAKIGGPNVYVRLNGRLIFPLEDRTGRQLEMTSEQWVEIAKAWFDEQKLEVSFDSDSKDLLKFTVLVPALGLPEGFEAEEEEETEGGEETETAPEDETEPPEGEETPESGEGTPEEETAPKAPETPSETEEESGEEPGKEKPEETAPEEESTDEELKEFEEALGI